MPESRKSRILNRAALALVFTLSFATYFAPDLSVALQLAPLALFAALACWRVYRSAALFTTLAGFFEADGLLYIILLSLLMLESSFGSSMRESYQFALLLSVCLLFARMYMAVVPLQEVFEAFYWSAILSLLVFLPLSFEMIMQSLTTLERLMVFNFHPNLLGLQLAGFLCVLVWKFMTGSWQRKVFLVLVGIACTVVIFLTSSRGAIVGIAAGFVFLTVAAIGRAAESQRKRILWITASVVALLAVTLAFAYNFESTKVVFDGADQILALSSSERGLDSGMTGRVDLWHQVLRVFGDGSWLFGHGVRSSDTAYVDPSIDNSYLVILYDMGLVPLILIVWRFFSILRNVTWCCFHTADPELNRLYMACGMFLVVLLVTAIVERSLFAVGNPFSLLAFLFFAAPAQFWPIQRETSRFDPQPASPMGSRLAPNM